MKKMSKSAYSYIFFILCQFLIILPVVSSFSAKGQNQNEKFAKQNHNKMGRVPLNLKLKNFRYMTPEPAAIIYKTSRLPNQKNWQTNGVSTWNSAANSDNGNGKDDKWKNKKQNKISYDEIMNFTESLDNDYSQTPLQNDIGIGQEQAQATEEYTGFHYEDTLQYIIDLLNNQTTSTNTRPRVFAAMENGQMTEIPTVVRIRLLIEQISKLSEVDMEMQVTFTLYQLWNDARLARHSREDLVIPDDIIKRLWKPDISIQRATQTDLHKTTENSEIMRLCPNGDIHYWTKLTSKITCQMHFDDYPLDRQICQITLYSFGFYSDELWLYWHQKPNAFHADSVDTLANVHLNHYRQSVESIEYCPSDENQTDFVSDVVISEECVAKNYLIHEFEFARSFYSVFFVSYLPALSMVILGGLSTFIDPKSSPARVGMGITTVLTVSTLIQSLKNRLPKVNYLTALEVYLWTCFFFIAGALVEYAYINYKTTVLPNERQEKTQRRTLRKRLACGTTFSCSGEEKWCQAPQKENSIMSALPSITYVSSMAAQRNNKRNFNSQAPYNTPIAQGRSSRKESASPRLRVQIPELDTTYESENNDVFGSISQSPRVSAREKEKENTDVIRKSVQLSDRPTTLGVQKYKPEEVACLTPSRNSNLRKSERTRSSNRSWRAHKYSHDLLEKLRIYKISRKFKRMLIDNFWRAKIDYSRSVQIDYKFRIFYVVAFLGFNIFYWTYYTSRSKHRRPEEEYH